MARSWCLYDPEMIRGSSFVTVAAVLAVLTACGGEKTGNSNSAGGAGVSARDAGSVPAPMPSNLDDWLSAVCKPGTFRDGNNRLPNAQAGGTCMSLGANAMPIFMGQYSSRFGMESDIAMFRTRSFAALETDSGEYQVFIALGPGSSALRSLEQYGFDLGVAG